MWHSLSEWRASQVHQCQGLNKACLCQGASFDGGQALALSSPPHPSTSPVSCEGPESPQAASCRWLFDSSSKVLSAIVDVGETAVITFLGKGWRTVSLLQRCGVG